MTTKDDINKVQLSPKTMTDSAAEWPLYKVVEHLKRKEGDEKGDVEVDCRLYHSSGIRMFNSVVDELASCYGVSRGKMCRWLSYHGISFAREDRVLSGLVAVTDDVRRLALKQDSHAVASIQATATPYSPASEDGNRTSIYVYNSWVLSEFSDVARTCGVAPLQVAQVYMIRSVMTSEEERLEGVVPRLLGEVECWEKWMRYRLATLSVAVDLWSGA